MRHACPLAETCNLEERQGRTSVVGIFFPVLAFSSCQQACQWQAHSPSNNCPPKSMKVLSKATMFMQGHKNKYLLLADADTQSCKATDYNLSLLSKHAEETTNMSLTETEEKQKLLHILKNVFWKQNLFSLLFASPRHLFPLSKINTNFHIFFTKGTYR